MNLSINTVVARFIYPDSRGIYQDIVGIGRFFKTADPALDGTRPSFVGINESAYYKEIHCLKKNNGFFLIDYQ